MVNFAFSPMVNSLVKPLKTQCFQRFLVIEGLHCGEQENVADCGGVGEEHGHTVDTVADAARGGHTDFKCV